MPARSGIVALLAAAALAWASPAAASPPPSGVERFATLIDTHAPLPEPALTAARARVVVLQSWNTAYALRLKLADPRVIVLAYLDLSGMTTAAGARFATGVQTHREGRFRRAGRRYADAHESWYLHTLRGSRFAFWDARWLWAANIADPGYQAQWARNATRMLAARPEFDGVFVDDVNPTIRYHWDPADVRELPTDAAYQAATAAALGAISVSVRALGRLVYANVGAWSDYGEQVRPWIARDLDGAMDEMWAKWGDRPGSGWRDEAGWARQVANAADASAAGVTGVTVLTVTHSSRTDAAAARYGYASALLASQGRVLFESTGDYHSATWFGDYETDLGAPAGPMTADASGVRRRRFTRGLVLVNPTLASQSAALGGTFSGDGLGRATSATLRPHSALILTGVERQPAAKPASVMFGSPWRSSPLRRTAAPVPAALS